MLKILLELVAQKKIVAENFVSRTFALGDIIEAYKRSVLTHSPMITSCFRPFVPLASPSQPAAEVL